MAEELKRKFQEIQEAKHGKREELKIDEFEWIEVRQRILNKKQIFFKNLSAQQTTRGGQKLWKETSGDSEWEADEEVQGEPPDPHGLSSHHRVPGQWLVQVWSPGLRRVAGHDARQDCGSGIKGNLLGAGNIFKYYLCQEFSPSFKLSNAL